MTAVEHETLSSPAIDRAEAEARARFDALQRKLVPLWRSIQRFTQDPQTIVVVPSITLDATITGARQQAYEERFLFLLLLLRQPQARLIYATSQAVHPEIIEYYLDLLPGVLASHARKRLFLVSPLDGSSQPLTQKLLARPRLIRHIRSLIADRDRAHLVPFNTTPLERELALRLDIPMYGADSRLAHLGTKSGARRVFSQVGVPHPLGAEHLHSPGDVVDAVIALRAQKAALSRLVVKLNEGVSGEGNAALDLTNLPAAGGGGERAAIAARVQDMQFELAGVTHVDYMQRLAKGGGIVEERIAGRDFRSPSAQLRVTPLGEVEALSTHDQLLGGPGGQSYLGCRFPASQEYGPAIMREALKVGRRLRDEGVLGRFAIDFVAVRNDQNVWEVYAIEINLRKGGTTHPFLTLQFLTDGSYDAEAGVFLTPQGQQKCFVASDHVESPLYRAFTHSDLFDIVARHGLHYDQARHSGVVFHMMNALGELGLLGLTAVANSHLEAEAMYQKAVSALDEEARAAAVNATSIELSGPTDSTG